jgi:DNA polymerase-1
MSNIIEQAKQKGYVETLFGRRRYLPDIRSSNANVRGMAERNAINAPIQGTAADMIKKAMIDIYRVFNESGLRSKMILQVHDELVFDVYRPELEQVKTLVKDGMEKVCSLKVPLIVEIGTGDNWLDAH